MSNVRNFVFVLAIAGGLMAAAPANAAAAGAGLSEREYRDFERRAYDNGFRTGVERGERDAQERRDFRVERSRDYRDADEGFRGDGDRDAYRRVFQDGFRSGYAMATSASRRLERARAVAHRSCPPRAPVRCVRLNRREKRIQGRLRSGTW